MNVKNKPNGDVMQAIRRLKEEGGSDVPLRDMIGALNAATSFPANEEQRTALVNAYGEVKSFAPQDGGDFNYKAGALAHLLGSALGASSVTMASNNPVSPAKIAEEFVTKNLAEARGWKIVDIMERMDATEDWALSLKWPHFYDPDEATRDAKEATLVKYDFHLDVVEKGVETTKEVGVAMNRETGEILEVYVGREKPRSPDAL